MPRERIYCVSCDIHEDMDIGGELPTGWKMLKEATATALCPDCRAVSIGKDKDASVLYQSALPNIRHAHYEFQEEEEYG